MFELVIEERDSQGKPTGKRKSFSTDSSYSLWVAWMKHVGNIPTKRNKSVIPTEEEAKKILAQMYKD